MMNRSAGGYFKIIDTIKKEWSDIKKEKLLSDIRELYKSKLISMRENDDGTMTVILNDKGKERALRYSLEKMKIPDQIWDGGWRIVVFDIPESRRNARDALRCLLKKMNFYELQKSVFIHPFDCKNEIDFLIEFFQLNKHVRYGVLRSIDNELHLRNIFRKELTQF